MHTSQYPRHLKPKRIQNKVIEPPLLDDDRSDTTKCSDKALSGSQLKISNTKNSKKAHLAYTYLDISR